MSDQPVDDHSEEFELLAGLSALHLLEDDELARFEQHADGCQRCRLMVRLDRQALAGVSLVAPEMDPSPDFKQRLMRRAAAELASSATAQPPQPIRLTPPASNATTPPGSSAAPTADSGAAVQPIPFRRPSRGVVRLWQRSPWLSALAAVIVLGLVSLGAYGWENQPVARYALSGNAPGTAAVVLRRSGAAELEMQDVPDPDPGFVYEAWIIPAGKNPVAAGTLASGNAKLSLPGDVRGTTVAITRERGRVDAPTSDPLMAAVVQL